MIFGPFFRLCCLVLLATFQLQAQSYETENFGLSTGFSLHFGSHRQQLGWSFKAYYLNNHFQANLETACSFGLKGFGPNEKRWEGNLKLGVLGGIGHKNLEENPFLHALSNQSNYDYAAAYAFHFYWDNIQTGQISGSFGFHAKRFELLFENDILAFTGQDKYRTGALGLSWREQNFKFKQQVILWTGDQLHPKARLVRDSNYPSRFGYCELSQTPYGNFSHGIFSLGLEYALPYGQIAGIQLGVDAEQIRHFFQNKLIHDFPLIPEKWNKAKTPHLPMLQENGSSYLFLENQAVRKARFFIDFFLNSDLFY